MARYGRRHHEMRLRELPRWIGRPCVRCGEVMDNPKQMDLDHTDDGQSYLGFSHSKCNRSVAGKNPMGIGSSREVVSPAARSATAW